jgi:hypothetical protein
MNIVPNLNMTLSERVIEPKFDRARIIGGGLPDSRATMYNHDYILIAVIHYILSLPDNLHERKRQSRLCPRIIFIPIPEFGSDDCGTTLAINSMTIPPIS